MILYSHKMHLDHYKLLKQFVYHFNVFLLMILDYVFHTFGFYNLPFSKFFHISPPIWNSSNLLYLTLQYIYFICFSAPKFFLFMQDLLCGTLSTGTAVICFCYFFMLFCVFPMFSQDFSTTSFSLFQVLLVISLLFSEDQLTCIDLRVACRSHDSFSL